MATILFPLIYIIACIAISHFVGRTRQIGYGWSSFFTFFLTPVIGTIIIFCSNKVHEPKPYPSRLKRILGMILLTGSLIIFIRLQYHFFIFRSYSDIEGMIPAIGLIGLGYYLVQVGRGKSWGKSKKLQDGFS